MYNLFSTKSKPNKYLQEGEPPPKKLTTEGDVVIKQLSEKQLTTKTTLCEQLNKTKEFTTSGQYVDITTLVRGATDLKSLQNAVEVVNEREELERKGLIKSDIDLYRDYLSLGITEFCLKYQQVNKDVLEQKVNSIKKLVEKDDESDAINIQSRHQQDYLNCIKPGSVETKLLKFATQQKSTHLPSPMDGLHNVQQEFEKNIEDFSKCNLKHIRKKARSLGNKIKELNNEANKLIVTEFRMRDKIQRDTKWDVKELEQPTVEIVDKSKVYSCKPQKIYTIKDGKIVQINEKTINEDKPKKLSIKEIKDIPKFANYQPGEVSNKLFLKNLAKSVTEERLKELLKNQCSAIRLMNGKMRGQAFVEFQDESEAETGLEILNGEVIGGRPIIAQFAKSTKDIL